MVSPFGESRNIKNSNPAISFASMQNRESNDSRESSGEVSGSEDAIRFGRSPVWNTDRVESFRSIALDRINSRKGGTTGCDRESLIEQYSILSRDELVDLLISSEMHASEIENESYALVEQINQCQRDISGLESDLVACKLNHSIELSALKQDRDKYETLYSQKESEVIFLEDHARFSADQTKLSISHWDLLLKNRDENIELLTARVASLVNISTIPDASMTVDSFKCLQDRVKSLTGECKSLREKLGLGTASTEGIVESSECPWRHQADVRVAQLERLTSQLNVTYSQLHAKSDELLLQNRELGIQRRKSFDYEAKLKKYRNKVAVLRQRLDEPPPSVPTTETSSIQSSD